MPRQTRAQAEKTVKKYIDVRWRLLLRNLEFQQDMQLLNDRYFDKRSTANSRENHRISITDKWGLLSIPWEAVIYWPGYPLEAEDYPSLENYLRNYPGGIVDYSPVTTTELLDDRFLFLRVDLKHPVQDLLPLIEQTLREGTKEYTKNRRYFDKINELTVFDIAIQGASYKKIATRLSLTESEVKRLFRTAVKKIYGKTEPLTKRQLVHKRLLADLGDPKKHVKLCPVCKSVRKTRVYCKLMRYYFNQDHVSQRESTGHNTTR